MDFNIECISLPNVYVWFSIPFTKNKLAVYHAKMDEVQKCVSFLSGLFSIFEMAQKTRSAFFQMSKLNHLAKLNPMKTQPFLPYHEFLLASTVFIVSAKHAGINFIPIT